MCEKESIYMEVKGFIESCGCSLITKVEEFINKSEPIEIRCGNCDDGVIKTRFSDFVKRKHKMCKGCISLQNRIKVFNEFKYFAEVESGSGCKIISNVNEFINSTSKLWFKCECGNKFQTDNRMFVHSNKRQCNECGFKRKGQTSKIIYGEVKEYIENQGMKLITPEEEYVNAAHIIDIQCKCGNNFKNTFSQFKYGKGTRCDECNRREISERNTIPYAQIKHFVEIKSNSGCKLLTSEENYVNTRLNIEFECNCGEPFNTSFHEFKSGNKRQCNICGNSHMTTKEFIALFDEKEKINFCELIEYEDTNGVVRHRSAVKLRCSCGETFETIRSYFTDRGKNRCEKCTSALTKGEERVRNFLEQNNIINKWQYYFDDCRGKRKPLPFDFAVFDGKNNLISLIEYDGKQHFEPVNFGGCSDETALQEHINLRANDSIKNEYCKRNNIPLIRIPYWELDNIEEILNEKLNNYILQTV